MGFDFTFAEKQLITFDTAPQIGFHEANAQDLGADKFKDDSYDLYTIAFGIRNCTSITAVLKEAHRVLRPGGTFACLEFNHVVNPLFSACVLSLFPSSSLLMRPLQCLRPVLIHSHPSPRYDLSGR
jgi:ubiquinone/menaquinone biosynthesis C-methylase UbiE